jgi:hypothetical protein
MGLFNLSKSEKKERSSNDLEMHMHFFEHHTSQELLRMFTAKGEKELNPVAKLAVAKLLFGLDKSVEDAEREIRLRKVRI